MALYIFNYLLIISLPNFHIVRPVGWRIPRLSLFSSKSRDSQNIFKGAQYNQSSIAYVASYNYLLLGVWNCNCGLRLKGVVEICSLMELKLYSSKSLSVKTEMMLSSSFLNSKHTVKLIPHLCSWRGNPFLVIWFFKNIFLSQKNTWVFCPSSSLHFGLSWN